MKLNTKLIHAGVEPDDATGAIMTPIYQTSTYVQSAPGVHKGYEYSRTLNPTRDALEKNIAQIENAKYGLCFASGMAAIDTVLHLLTPGDELICSNDVYGGTARILNKVYSEKNNITTHFVDAQDIKEIESKINNKTRIIWVETPSNPLLQIIDIEAVSKLAKANSLLLVVDNTFATPYLQQPIDLGADIVIHSVTKYLGGHSDVVMGALGFNSPELYEELSFYQNSVGGVPGPFDCFLALRGIKTLHVRMERHSENAMKVADFLSNHSNVGKVYYPGLPEHKAHDVARKQMKNFGGMLSFHFKTNTTQEAHDFLKRLKLFKIAESLGGIESLAGHPATMTHAAIDEAKRRSYGISDGLVRLSVGIEDISDIIEDLDQALS